MANLLPRWSAPVTSWEIGDAREILTFDKYGVEIVGSYNLKHMMAPDVDLVKNIK